jgi:hypothetical protein
LTATMVDAQDKERPSAPSSPLADPSAEREDETVNNASNTAGSVQPEDSAVYVDIDEEDVEAFDEACWASLVSDKMYQSQTSSSSSSSNSNVQSERVLMPHPYTLAVIKEKTDTNDQNIAETARLSGKTVISKTVTISEYSQLLPHEKLDKAHATSPETTTTSTDINISTQSTAYRTANDDEISFSSTSATSLQNNQRPGAYSIQAPMTDPLQEQESTDNIMDSNHDLALIPATVVDDTTANSGQTDRVYSVNAQEDQHWDKWRVLQVLKVCVAMLVALMTVIMMVVFLLGNGGQQVVDKETSLGANTDTDTNTINITNTTVNNNNNSTPINLQGVYIVSYGSQVTCNMSGDKVIQFICHPNNEAILVFGDRDVWQCTSGKNKSVLTCIAAQFTSTNFAGGPPDDDDGGGGSSSMLPAGGSFPGPPGMGSTDNGFVAASSSPQNWHLQGDTMAYTVPLMLTFACAGNKTSGKGATFVLPPQNITLCTANSDAYGAFCGPTKWLNMHMLFQSNMTGLNMSNAPSVGFNVQALGLTCSYGPPLLLSTASPFVTHGQPVLQCQTIVHSTQHCWSAVLAQSLQTHYLSA